MPIEWIVWYSDGSSISNAEAAPDEIPRRGVICITCRSRDHGRIVWWNGEYYLWRYDSWVRGDANGLFDYLLEPGREKIVLFGRFIPNHRFEVIYKQAITDPRMTPKSSLSVQEERDGYGQDQTSFIVDVPRLDELV